eukprot:4722052-Lingulodinium_polyedra.AAC.1
MPGVGTEQAGRQGWPAECFEPAGLPGRDGGGHVRVELRDIAQAPEEPCQLGGWHGGRLVEEAARSGKGLASDEASKGQRSIVVFEHTNGGPSRLGGVAAAGLSLAQ